MINRRHFMELGASLSVAWFSPTSFALGQSHDPRLALLILRGGMDGLAAVPAFGDADYHRRRGDLAIAEPGREGGAFDLDGLFGLHGSLGNLHELYRAKELAIVHAVASPYTGRSHFTGQDVLESGEPDPSGSSTGWLYRALTTIPGGRPADEVAMAFGASIPMVLRGAKPVGAWSPDRLPEPDDDTMSRVLALYADDEVLGPKLRSMLKTEELVPAMDRAPRRNALSTLVKTAASMLKSEVGPRIAVFDAGGWDTHANQGSSTGQLAARFAALDAAITEFKMGLGETWQQTVLMVVTEFGRTVAPNGTRGTDHGVGSVAFVMGGAINGGQVLGEWPGLRRDALYEGRDLRPTTDLRAVFKSVLTGHLGADAQAVDEVVFPLARLEPIDGLLRTS